MGFQFGVQAVDYLTLQIAPWYTGSIELSASSTPSVHVAEELDPDLAVGACLRYCFHGDEDCATAGGGLSSEDYDRYLDFQP